MRINYYLIVRVVQEEGDYWIFWSREDQTEGYDLFTQAQMDVLLEEAHVQSYKELEGCTIIVNDSSEGVKCQYACIPKGAEFQIQVGINVTHGNGETTEVQLV